MGWPEFQKCCGCLSLTTGTVVIGCWTIILSLISGLVHLTLLILVHNNPDEWIPLFEYILAGIAIMIDLVQCVLGILLIVYNKNAKNLGKLVFYMIVLCLINLLVILVSVSTDNSVQHYFSAALIILDGYFILIVRSNQLQLEGRLTNPVDVRERTRRSLELGGLTTTGVTNNSFPPPPPYEEAIRFGALYRNDFNVAFRPNEEIIQNSVARDVALEPISSPSLPVEQPPVASSSCTENGKKDSPKEPEFVIYDERQFTAISAAQIVERSGVSNTN